MTSRASRRRPSGGDAQGDNGVGGSCWTPPPWGKITRAQELFSRQAGCPSFSLPWKERPMSPSPRLPRHPKPSASVESPLPDPVPRANCPGLIVSGSRGLKEAPERGARAGRVVQARGGASVPSSRSGGGPTGMHRLAVARGPALPQQGSPGAWLQLPRWSWGQRVRTRSPQPLLPAHTALGTERHQFPRDFP